MNRELLQQARDVLARVTLNGMRQDEFAPIIHTIAALEQALAQEPLCVCQDRPRSKCPGECEPGCHIRKLMAQPAQEPPYVEGVKPIWETLAEIGASAPDEAWQHVNQRGPLTDTQIRRIQAEHPTENDPMPFARAIEAAHGIT
jgi:hypothetical protein